MALNPNEYIIKFKSWLVFNLFIIIIKNNIGSMIYDLKIPNDWKELSDIFNEMHETINNPNNTKKKL